MDRIKFQLPGVIRLECVPKKKAFFLECDATLPSLLGLLQDLENGVSEYPDLAKDFQTYGREAFRVEIVACDIELAYSEKLKAALEKAKQEWNGDFY